MGHITPLMISMDIKKFDKVDHLEEVKLAKIVNLIQKWPQLGLI